MNNNDKSHHTSYGFKNPWDSFSNKGFTEALKTFAIDWNSKRCSIPPEDKKVPVIKPDFKVITSPPNDKLVVTWLGHACFLVQFNNLNILTDPVFSCKCSPSQWVGPSRFTNPPCEMSQLPPIDVVIISHNHYDHLDIPTLKQIPGEPKFYVPLANRNLLIDSVAIPADRVMEMDWWDEANHSVSGTNELLIACTPCQHFSSRTLFDRNHTLWASWVIKSKAHSFYFAGDTGYCTVPREIGDLNNHDPQNNVNLPCCPAFKEIGDKYGPFDLACIPIGAYSPRHFMSAVHCSPEDAICVHQDVGSKMSIGMHWGTWILTDENPTEPPVRLMTEMKRKGLNPSTFVTTKIGESLIL
jgi:N-acyl-phosphatidylethanolamine-hydrolysing phospholipase D